LRFGILQMSPVPSGSWWRDQARQVEDLGFSTLLLSDHFDRSPVGPISAMAAAAAVTDKLHVGTLVLNNDLRHPAVLAKELASIALLSGGRLEIGMGAGWMRADYDQIGADPSPAGDRIARLGEALDILHGLLGRDPVTYRGAAYRVEAMVPVPAGPIGGVKFLVGGGARQILSLAARRADIVGINWNVRAGVMGVDALESGTPEATDRKLAWVRTAAGDNDPEIHLQCYLLQRTDRPLDAVTAWLRSLGASGAQPALVLQSPHVLVGSDTEIVEKLVELQRRWGVSYVSFYDLALADAARIIQLVGS